MWRNCYKIVVCLFVFCKCSASSNDNTYRHLRVTRDVSSDGLLHHHRTEINWAGGSESIDNRKIRSRRGTKEEQHDFDHDETKQSWKLTNFDIPVRTKRSNNADGKSDWGTDVMGAHQEKREKREAMRENIPREHEDLNEINSYIYSRFKRANEEKYNEDDMIEMRNKRELRFQEEGRSSNEQLSNTNFDYSLNSIFRNKRDIRRAQDTLLNEDETVNEMDETFTSHKITKRSTKNVHQAAATQQVSSYTSYELKPAATGHKGKSSGKGGGSGHKAGFKASSGHKSGEGHKTGKGFEIKKKGSHDKKGASGHSGGGGKKYAGADHKSHKFSGGTSGKKGSKGSSRGHKAHHSKGSKKGGFKNANAKEESGGKKGFYDKSDHKGYHSKYDHFDSFHESTSGGSKEGKSHKTNKKHDVHAAKGHHDSGKKHADKASHKAAHGGKTAHAHKKSTDNTASHKSAHKSKH